jgi:hypothetical protein
MKILRVHLLALSAAALLSSTGADAQGATDGSAKVYSLTPEEKAKVLEAGTEASAEMARAGLPGGSPDRQVHGEIGAAIGTGGARAAYGVAAMPLGDRAGAVVSFESSRFGTDRRR